MGPLGPEQHTYDDKELLLELLEVVLVELAELSEDMLTHSTRYVAPALRCIAIIGRVVVRITIVDIFTYGAGVGPDARPHDLLTGVTVFTSVFRDTPSQGVCAETGCICNDMGSSTK